MSPNTTTSSTKRQRDRLTHPPGLLQNQPTLTSNLNNARNITILAPSNDAFSKFLSTPAGQAASNNPDMLTALLQYHVLQGAHTSQGLNTTLYVHSALTNTAYANVTNGQVVQLSKMGNKVMAMSGNKEMSMSTTMDVMFTGGVVHVIDKVLTVPMVRLISLLLSSAPMSKIIKYQLTPLQMPSRAAVDSGLTGLAGALRSANIVSAVDSTRDLTIFAPSNAAFERIGSALPALQADQAMFRNLLAYHLVNRTVVYAGMLGNVSLMTAQGGQVRVEVVNKKVFVNSALVIISDVIVANGVVHVIDK